MNIRLVIAIAVLIVVVILGGILIAMPTPTGNGNGNNPPSPFVSENVKVNLPFPGATVLKTFTASGEARGTWFFEASFPVEVRDPNGAVVGRGIAQAQEEWMTEDFVPFNAPVTIENYSGPATLVLIKDNPSGLPEHDDSVLFPIVVQ